MAGGPPILEIGADSALGAVLQPTFGTPVVVPANGLNWVEWKSRAIKYNNGRKLYKTGAGTRSTTRKRGRAKANTTGGFAVALQNIQGVSFLAYFFGHDGISGAGPYLHTFDNSVGSALVTMEVQRSGQSYQVQDTYFDTVTLSLTGDDEWQLAYTIMGGNGGAEIASAVPTHLTDFNELNLGDLTAATLPGGVAVGALVGATIKFSNGVKQGWGGGSVHPTKAAIGEWTITGDLDYYFDTAAAATSIQNAIAGTESTLALTIGGHVITLPNTNILEPDWTDQLAELGRVKATFEVRNPGSATWAVSNTQATAYV